MSDEIRDLLTRARAGLTSDHRKLATTVPLLVTAMERLLDATPGTQAPEQPQTDEREGRGPWCMPSDEQWRHHMFWERHAMPGAADCGRVVRSSDGPPMTGRYHRKVLDAPESSPDPLEDSPWLDPSDVTRSMIDACHVWESRFDLQRLYIVHHVDDLPSDGAVRPLRLLGMNARGEIAAADMTQETLDRVCEWQWRGIGATEWHPPSQVVRMVAVGEDEIWRPAIFAQLDAEPEQAPEPPASEPIDWTAQPRDPARIDAMVERLRVLWHRAPDLRLVQLVLNTQYGHTGAADYSRAYHIEDRDMYRLLGLDPSRLPPRERAASKLEPDPETRECNCEQVQGLQDDLDHALEHLEQVSETLNPYSHNVPRGYLAIDHAQAVVKAFLQVQKHRDDTQALWSVATNTADTLRHSLSQLYDALRVDSVAGALARISELNQLRDQGWDARNKCNERLVATERERDAAREAVEALQVNLQASQDALLAVKSANVELTRERDTVEFEYKVLEQSHNGVAHAEARLRECAAAITKHGDTEAGDLVSLMLDAYEPDPEDGPWQAPTAEQVQSLCAPEPGDELLAARLGNQSLCEQVERQLLTRLMPPERRAVQAALDGLRLLADEPMVPTPATDKSPGA